MEEMYVSKKDFNMKSVQKQKKKKKIHVLQVKIYIPKQICMLYTKNFNDRESFTTYKRIWSKQSLMHCVSKSLAIHFTCLLHAKEPGGTRVTHVVHIKSLAKGNY